MTAGLTSPDGFRLRYEYSGVIPWQPHSKMRPKVSRGGHRTHQDPRDAEAERKTREFFAQDAVECGMILMTDNVAVNLKFYRASAQIVDLDNLVKHFLDSGNGMIWVDDLLVTRIVAELHLDRTNPRTEFLVRYHQDSSMVRHRDPKEADPT
jgi:Holliday junction resolvase RusA-like endonuclease